MRDLFAEDADRAELAPFTVLDERDLDGGVLDHLRIHEEAGSLLQDVRHG